MAMDLDYKEMRHLYETEGGRATLDLLDDAIGERKIDPNGYSLLEAAEEWMGREFVQSLRPKSGRWSASALREAAGTAVAYSMFSNITGQIAFSTIKQGFDLPEFVFSKAIPTKPSDILDSEKIPGISEIGDEFSVVDEEDEFPFVGVTEDYIEIARKSKRGAIIRVTKEAIRGDKTGLLLERCRKLGRWLGLNREKRLIDAVIDENGGATSIVNRGHRYHWKGTSYATFQASTPWVNIKTSNGLADWTDLDNAWLLLQNLRDPFTGEPITVIPDTIIVTPQNFHLALTILHAMWVRRNSNISAGTANIETQAPSPIADINYKLLSSALLADRAATDTDWWYGNPGQAINYFSVWDVEPEELGRDSTEAFKRDVVMQFKASEMGAAATMEPRALVENQA